MSAPADEWLTEWAVEVTWADWRKAGAKGPTSQFGPFDHPFQRDQFVAKMRRDRDITAIRVLTRRAVYTEWTAAGERIITSPEERERLLAEHFADMFAPTATGEADDERR